MNIIINEVHTLGVEILKNKLVNAGFPTEVIYHYYEESINVHKPEVLYISWNYSKPIYNFLCELPKIKEKYPQMKVIIGGFSATHDYKNLSELPWIDAIIGNYADDAIVPCTVDILNGSTDKLKYLNPPEVNLDNYDYDSNIFIMDRIAILETSRSCPRAKFNVCSYCSQYREPYRQLDLNKILNTLKNKRTDFDRILIVDPSVLTNTVNTIYEEFGCPIACTTEANNLKNIKTNNCYFSIGFDYPGEANKYNPLKETKKEQINNIIECSKNNIVMAHSVVPSLNEKTKLEKSKLFHYIYSNYPSIVLKTFMRLEIPGTSEYVFNKDIYLNKIKLTTLGDAGSIFRMTEVSCDLPVENPAHDQFPIITPRKKVLYLMDTQWGFVKGHDFQKVQNKKLTDKETNLDIDFVNNINNFVREKRKDYYKVVTSFTAFDTNVEENTYCIYRENAVDMLPYIKNKFEIQSFVPEVLIDNIYYDYNARTNKPLLAVLDECDIIDVLGTTIDGCYNEIVNMLEDYGDTKIINLLMDYTYTEDINLRNKCFEKLWEYPNVHIVKGNFL